MRAGYETMPGWKTPTGAARVLKIFRSKRGTTFAVWKKFVPSRLALISVSPSRESFVLQDQSLLDYPARS
jgi:adenylosuccinate synthase